MTIEHRIVAGTIAPAADGKTFEGRVAPYNTPTYIGPQKRGFFEQVDPAAFTKDLAAGVDVVGLFNHNPDHLLGRTSAKTMTLESRTDGLYAQINLPDTNAGRDVRESVQRGDITGMSFSFEARDASWSKLKEGSMEQLRSLRDVGVFDVGPVTMPAYPTTTASLRSVDGFRLIEVAEGDEPPNEWVERTAHTIADALRQGYTSKPYKADPDETIKCPECGRMNDADANYCDQCGVKLVGRTDVMHPAAPGVRALDIAQARHRSRGRL